jgi:hypothetical protein
MNRDISQWKRMLVVCVSVLMAACVSYSGSNLKPGVSTSAEVIASMGEPAMVWKNPDGSAQLAYPRGPAGTQTFMAYIGPDGKLQRIEGVLDMAHFAKIQAGMSKEEVQRIIGPSGTLWTRTFSNSNTVVWSWLFCDSTSLQSFFDVIFDATTGLVRSTEQRPNYGGLGIQPTCGH